MKSIAIWVVILVFSVLIQAVFLADFFGTGARPDLLLVIVVSAGLLGGKEVGFGVGFFAGLLQDLASGNVLGLNTISKMSAGYAAGLVENKVFKDSFLLPVFSAVMATFLSELIVFIFLYVFGYQSDSWRFFTSQLLAKAGYNLIIALPIHRIIYRFGFRYNILK